MRSRADIYILHITRTDGETLHYIGATKRGRFEERLKEHRIGRGALVTKAAIAAGATIEGAIIHTNALAEEELIYQSLLPLEGLCPICNGIKMAASWPEPRKPEPVRKIEHGDFLVQPRKP